MTLAGPADRSDAGLEFPVFRPRSLNEALKLRSEHPEARPIAGGTDLMVEINFGHLHPRALLDLSAVEELRRVRRADGRVIVGAGATYAQIMRELPEFIALFEASRIVGSPQIRSRATIGGNLGTASPAGDALPVLAAYEASIGLRGPHGSARELPVDKFLCGPRRTALADDELIATVAFPDRTAVESYAKIGRRNAMVISIAGLCLRVDPLMRTVRVALGSVGPTIIRPTDAEAFAEAALAEVGAWDRPGSAHAPRLPDDVLDEFATRVGAASRPIDDVRGSAQYRRHACTVLARRALAYALDELAARDG